MSACGAERSHSGPHTQNAHVKEHPFVMCVMCYMCYVLQFYRRTRNILLRPLDTGMCKEALIYSGF